MKSGYITSVLGLVVLISACGGGGGSGSTGVSSTMPEPPAISPPDEPAPGPEQPAKPAPSNCTAGQASGGSEWCWAEPLPLGADINRVAANGGRYLFVGENGLALYTEDFAQWNSIHTRHTDDPYYDAAFSADRAAISHPGGVLTSTNLVDWSNPDRLFSSLAVHHADGKWVSVGIAGDIAVSEDGIHWRLQNIQIPNSEFGFWQNVHYGNGNWVVVGDDGYILTSSDGENWSRRRIAPINLNAVAYDELRDAWVVVGYGLDAEENIFTSSDLINWQAHVSGTVLGLDSVAVFEGHVVATSSYYTLYESEDLTVWSEHSVGDFTNTYGSADIIYDHTNKHWMRTGTGGRVETSNDLESWEKVISPTLNSIKSIDYHASTGFIAAGEDYSGKSGLLHSDDGISWKRVTSMPASDITKVKFGKNIWVAIGGDSIYTSTDGHVWRAVYDLGLYILYDLEYDESSEIWVAVGSEGRILVSNNAHNWTPSSSGVDNSIHEISYHNGTWLAVSDEGHVLLSTDTLSWETSVLPGSNLRTHLSNSIYALGEWHIFTNIRSHYTSTDGRNWQYHNSAPANVTDIEFGRDKWMLTTLNGEIYSSSDLSRWEELNDGSNSSNDNDIIHVNGTWYVGNDGGAIRYFKE